MANVGIFQARNKRLVFAPEATVGTAATLDGTSFLVPAQEIAINPAGRGTGIIDRSGISDGYAGAVLGAPGSFGSTLTFKSEIYDIAGVNIDNYFSLLLAACGHARAESPANTWNHTPSQNFIANYASETTSPIALTFGVYQDVDSAGTFDYAMYMTGSTGKASLEFPSGERALLACDFKGVSSGEFINNGVSALVPGTFPAPSATPYVVKGITATFTDTTSTNALDTVALASVVLDSAADVPDVPDPTKENGFAVSPVLFNNAPTVSFTVGATSLNNTYFWQNFKAGRTISIVITLTGAGGRSITVNLPKVQFVGLAFGEADGYVTYEVEGQCVRDLNSPTIYTISIVQAV